MAVTITVPGANNSTLTQTYTGAGNSALALSLANTLDTLVTQGVISVTSVAGGTAVPTPGTTGTQELAATGGGVFSVPAGYNFVVTDSTQAQTIVGGTHLVAGDNNVDFTNYSGATSSVIAGNGNDVFNLSGSYNAAAGSGADFWALSGTGQVSLGGGVNAVAISGGADTIFAAAGSSGALIVGGHGFLWFQGGNNPTTVVDTIIGGAGLSTIVGGNNEAIAYSDGASSAAGLLVAGAGNETLFAAASSGTDALYSSFQAGTKDALFASATANAALVGGSGTDSLIGGGGHDVFYILNATLSNLTPGTDLIFNANPNDAIALIGFDTLYGGAAGSDTAGKLLSAAFASTGSLTLKDGTTITFANTGSGNGIHFVSS